MVDKSALDQVNADLNKLFLQVENQAPKVDLANISNLQKIDYGLEQETTILGNTFQAGKAFLNSVLGEGDFSLNLQKAESLRQQAIDRDNPELAGLKVKDEDAVIIGGRIAQGFADPVYYVLPWARVAQATAKAGKAAQTLSTAGLGGGVSAVENTLRQTALTGEIDPIELGITTAVGTVATGGIDALLRRSKSARDFKKEAESASMGALNPDLVPPKNVNLFQGIESPLSSKETIDLGKVTTEVIEEVGEGSVKQTGLDARDLGGQIRFITHLDKRIVKLENLLNSGLTDKRKNKVETILANANKYRNFLDKKYLGSVVSNMEESALLNGKVLDKLAKENKLTNNIFKTIVYETTRPIFGALGGGVIGNMFDEDGSHENIYYGIALGTGLGFLQKHIQRSSALSKIDKETGQLLIDESALKGLSFQLNRLKYSTATTVATKMEALGGYGKALSTKLFSRVGSGTDSIEARTIREEANFLSKLYGASGIEAPSLKGYFSETGRKLKKVFAPNVEQVNNEVKNINVLAGEVMHGFTDINSIKPGYVGLTKTLTNVTEEQIEEVKRVIPLFSALRDGIKNKSKDSGIPFEELDNYGLAHIFDNDFINKNYNKFVVALEKAKDIQVANGGKSFVPLSMAENITGKSLFTKGAKYPEGSDTVFQRDELGNLIFRGTSDFFENSRTITDGEASKFLASQGFLKLNAQEVLAEYGSKSIKVAEFSKTLGANGELVNYALKNINEAFKSKMNSQTMSEAQLNRLQQANRTYQKIITDGIEAYWGVHGKTSGAGSEYGVRTLQALANMQYLSTVSIANLPDLLQPFINSGFGVAAKQAFKSNFKPDERFSTIGNFKYDKTFEREIQNYLTTQSSNTYGSYLANIQDAYFSLVGLQKITQVARNFAYDVGVSRAYQLAKKGKLKEKEVRELETLGLSLDNLKEIKSYKTVQEAFKSDKGGVLLDIAGRKAADRDAIIPLIGNRLVFAQNRNPYVRSMGQFMSWTMAKGAQLNSTISRIENGDVRLALSMAPATAVYVGIRELKNFVNPTAKVDSYEDEDAVDKVFRSAKISGQFSNPFIDKAAEIMKYNVLRSDGDLAGGISPAYGYLQDVIGAFGDSVSDLKANDQEGALKELTDEVPLLSQSLGAYEKITGKGVLVDAPNRPAKRNRFDYAVGGEVDIPKASPEPDERIDKMTGLPYNIQAGIPFIDEEDPLKRLGLVGGGRIVTDPMQRLGFAKRTTI